MSRLPGLHHDAKHGHHCQQRYNCYRVCQRRYLFFSLLFSLRLVVCPCFHSRRRHFSAHFLLPNVVPPRQEGTHALVSARRQPR
eukprot:COSAG05_NODE_211_length_13978_cov_75.030189_2_plen_84_part_00